MLLRTSLSAAGALLLASGAFAQQDASAKVLPATTARDAGTYHVATGTWTRAKSPIAMIGTDVLYDNTCTIGFYFGLSTGESMVDSGRLPSLTSPASTQSQTGTSNTYDVDGVQVFYCTGEPQMDLALNFYDCYDPCADATGLVPIQGLTVVGLPGVGGGTGSLGCWALTLDLALTSGAPFTMFADCEGTYDGVASLDNFGWSFLQTNAQASGVASGPFMGGDPFGITTGVACPYGDGTFWSGNTATGTGIGTDDVFETDLGGVFNGCWFFGGYLSGNPYSSFALQMIGDAAGAPPVTGTVYCNADASGATLCPCGNDNDGTNGVAGCGNVTGPNVANGPGGVSLTATGNPSATGDTVVFTATGCQNNQPGLFFRADNAINGGSGITFGDGLRCAGGNIVRLQVKVADATGTAVSSAAMLAGLASSDVRRFQYWYRIPGGSSCGTDFNLSNGFEITVAP